ncbi:MULTISPECIES: hypothetical protein [Alteromonadaceae]|uniref:hypothetical protein n=1 Tax=Alteromonadaceae TaxID=72275 RepID=UPI001C097BEC|nr:MULTISPECIES: hypothetical protein [Aliiglaciecola]MBU2878835.1 hypothetical protein [Aliiglaciecola lipolytica]MDO6711266.1 hypothetical protein [Aliiglaciecola sp. 2_MG-2023]MDO6752285.1 hypothetical protein [Aliiglaciecola sp. 1_MG-2023]
MKNFKHTLQILLIAGSVFALAACEQGPAEDAGEKVDEMVTDAGNALEDACEDVKEGVKAEDKDC